MQSTATLSLLAFLASTTNAQWSTTQIPYEQDQAGGAGTFNKVYVVGGFDYSANAQNFIQEYDRPTGLWSDDPMILDNGRIKVASAICGNRLLCAGGWSYPSQVEVGAVEIYDLDTRLLLTEDQLSDPRVEIATAVVGDKVLFAGGQDAEWNGTIYDCVPSSVVDIYDATLGTWSVAQLSQARAGMASAVLNGKAYFAGGYLGNGTLTDRVDIYDAATDQWSTATLSVARAFYGGGLAIGGRVMFAGGITGELVCTDVVDIYDPVPDTWSTATLSSPREGVQAATVGNYAVFAGGGCGVVDWYYTTSSAVVDIYDAANDTWSTATMSSERINFLAAATGNEVLLIGGYDILSDVVPLTVDVFTDASQIGIAEPLQPRELNAWPNPFVDKLNIGALDALGGSTVEVYDAKGARVTSVRIKNSLGIDLSFLNDGLYGLRILKSDGTGVIASGSVMKATN
ncbi:MAG: kelch repeat-containing protein [Flavobacteriales bacterium]